MKRAFSILMTTVAFAVAVSSCERISKILHGDVVAKVGKYVLYRSEVEEHVPKGLSPEDSLKIAGQYVETWARENLFMDMAETRLSKSERDVTGELEDYRRSLLRYRYEQRYINERLDTLVLEDEIKDYYDAHKELFVLDVPIVKTRFMDIMPKSTNLSVLKTKMSSSDYSDREEADSLAFSSALRYEDNSDVWVDLVSVARQYDMNYRAIASDLRTGFIEEENEGGDIKYLYVCDFRRAGSLCPEEYCHERIKDIIISARKRTLISTLERDLLEDAREREHLIIY